ncbi:unnamed protein product [Chilo suppressalis]|uniref:Metalloendopeptidase n=1 Tax=Chilo suppressalis TaxID=168631 RepID=A0ABN8BD43_CHISP|nr:unnamed protein product [Chilo suppressalis]
MLMPLLNVLEIPYKYYMNGEDESHGICIASHPDSRYFVCRMILLIFVKFLLVTCIRAAPISEERDLNVLEYDGYRRGLPSNLAGELGEHFEGDMVLSKAQLRDVHIAIDRNGLRGGAKRWPQRTVVYHIEEDDFDEDQVKMIEEGMADLANKSCIQFVPRKSEKEHAVVIQGSANGCFSNVGFNTPDADGGEVNQVLNLAKGCFKHGTVVHEMLHTLGFYHMQSTYDRDEFVKIVWENILPGTEHNFAKYNNDTVTDFGVKYDYGSVMHYPEVAFSRNGNKTIIPLHDGVKIGQRNGLSESDVLKLNKMYCQDQSDKDDVQVSPRSRPAQNHAELLQDLGGLTS